MTDSTVETNHSVCQSAEAPTLAPTYKAVAVPAGIKPPQMPISVCRESDWVLRTIRTGPAIIVMTNAVPSKIRPNHSAHWLSEVSTNSPPQKANINADKRLRRAPNALNRAPINNPPTTNMMLNAATSQEPTLSVQLNCSIKIGSTGANFAVLMPEIAPANVTARVSFKSAEFTAIVN